jgi:hypothetical protein
LLPHPSRAHIFFQTPYSHTPSVADIFENNIRGEISWLWFDILARYVDIKTENADRRNRKKQTHDSGRAGGEGLRSEWQAWGESVEGRTIQCTGVQNVREPVLRIHFATHHDL